jgi:hypothetical protein
MTIPSRIMDRFPDFKPLSAADLLARGSEIQAMGHNLEGEAYMRNVEVSLSVDTIVYESDPHERLAKVNATFRNSTRGTWGTGLRQDGWDTPTPIVAHSIGAPVCSFSRSGAPEKDFADCRFIVAAHENFEWLVGLAKKGLEAEESPWLELAKMDDLHYKNGHKVLVREADGEVSVAWWEDRKDYKGSCDTDTYAPGWVTGERDDSSNKNTYGRYLTISPTHVMDIPK